jgi:hypothetical protein
LRIISPIRSEHARESLQGFGSLNPRASTVQLLTTEDRKGSRRLPERLEAPACRYNEGLGRLYRADRSVDARIKGEQK